MADTKLNINQLRGNIGLPGDTYDELTWTGPILSDDKAELTAPANGWFYAAGRSTRYDTVFLTFIRKESDTVPSESFQWPGVRYHSAIDSGSAICGYIPVKKGDTVLFWHEPNLTPVTLRFYYCNGEYEQLNSSQTKITTSQLPTELELTHSMVCGREYDELSYTQSGTLSLTAPSDGWYSASANLNNTISRSILFSRMAGDTVPSEVLTLFSCNANTRSSNNAGVSGMFPARKGDVILLNTQASLVPYKLRFYYNVGSESDKQN